MCQRWRDCYGARLISPPKRNSKTPWPKGLRRWLAGIRQIVETVFDKLHHAFRLDRERPHHHLGMNGGAAKVWAVPLFQGDNKLCEVELLVDLKAKDGWAR